jgi:hypothetical protein
VALRLGHVIDREKADIGVLIVMDKPTRPMKEDGSERGVQERIHRPLVPEDSDIHRRGLVCRKTAGHSRCRIVSQEGESSAGCYW